MPRPYQNIEVERFPVAFAQTISWMPPGDGVNVLFDGRSVNFHYYDPTGAPTDLFHGVPIHTRPSLSSKKVGTRVRGER